MDKTRKAVPVEATSYASEAELQEIIANNPNILLRDSERDSELYLVKRELTIPGTFQDATDLSLDHFMVDEDGIPVLVEVKQVSNPEIRRKVVGQMLEYAARISYYDGTELQEMFAGVNGRDAPNDRPREFWKTVSSNLRSGRMRLVFAADSIPNTLKVIIEMLDRCMQNMDVYGVEIQKHISGGDAFLSTSFILNTAKAVNARSDERAKYSDKDAREWLTEAYGEPWAYDFFVELRSTATAMGYTAHYGAGSQFIQFHYGYGSERSLFHVSMDHKGGSVYFNTQAIARFTGDRLVQSLLLKMLSEIDENAKYTRASKYTYLRTTLRHYKAQENREKLYNVLREIIALEGQSNA